MIKNLLFSFVAVLGLAMPAIAQTDVDNTDKDVMYVVKNGKVVGQYEVGKDVDYITFTKPAAPQVENFVQYGSTKVDMKSAFVMEMNGYTYVFISPEDNIPADYQKIMGGESNYAMITIPTGLLDKDVKISDYNYADDDAPMFSAYYMSPDGPLGGTSSFDCEDDGFSDGTFRVDVSDGEVSVAVKMTSKDGEKDFELSYYGSYAKAGDDSGNTFVVDGQEYKVKAAFYRDGDAVMDLYLTNGDIDNARKLEDVYQYAHIQVPYSVLDGSKIDITGNTVNFKFDFVDNIQEQTYNLSNGNVGNATGYISVQMMTENTYKVDVNVENFGTGRDFSAMYDGEYMVYDVSQANAYRLQNQDDVKLQSAVMTHSGDVTTVYLSRKENVKTVADMADADLVIEIPDAFLTGETKGFSGTDTNAKISITYDGVKYNQASCNGADDAKALGGNVNALIEGKNLTIDFNVFNIYRYSDANLSGHYEGPITVGK